MSQSSTLSDLCKGKKHSGVGFHPEDQVELKQRNMLARRGGLQSHHARSQEPGSGTSPNTSRDSGSTPSQIHPSSHHSSTTPALEQQRVESPSPQQLIGSPSSGSVPQVPTHEEDVIQQQEDDLIEDPPSGGDLPSAYWGPPNTQIVEDDLLDIEMVDPGTKGKRGINIAPTANERRALRVNVTLNGNGLFADDGANKVISHRMKYFFDPRYTSWEKVQKSHRQLLWKEFGMACRWETNINEEIARQWNRVNGVKYRNMMSQAQKLAKQGFRSDWMQVRHYWKCKRYWDSPEFKDVSAQNQKNRGVKFDEVGKALKANPTHTGGQKSIIKRGDTLDAYAETKKKVKRKMGEGSSTGGNNEEKEWITDQPQILIERYLKILDEKYKDRPEERPSNSEPRDPLAWAEAVGGAKRGRVQGVSELANPRLLGYPTTRRQPMPHPSHIHITSMEEYWQKEMREKCEQMQADMEKKLREEREQLENDLQKEKDQIHAEKELFKTDLLKQIEGQVQHQIQMALSGQQQQHQKQENSKRASTRSSKK